MLALTPWTAWTDGAWPDLAARVAGPWLGRWLAVAGMVSAFALFNALLLVYSRIPLVLAQDGLLPGPLAGTDARGTPRNAVLVSAVVYSVFALLPFGGLLAGDVLLYSAALALEFAALVRLRRAEPELRGAFRLPVGVAVLVALAALPILLLVGRRTRGPEPGDRAAGSAGGRRARRRRATPVRRAARAPGAARAGARAVTPLFALLADLRNRAQHSGR